MSLVHGADRPAAYSRAHPSPRYALLQRQYARMHETGAPALGLPADQTFAGESLFAHLAPIRALIRATGAKTILDYGAGKGFQYRPQPITVGGHHTAESVAEYWDVDEIVCYDPGYAPHAELPQRKFDGVVCTDVLEHCPEEDLAWILDEILGYATSFVYLNVACFPARKSLPNGENAHVTIHPPRWWQEFVARRAEGHAGLQWELHATYDAKGRIEAEVYRSAQGRERPLQDITTVSIEGQPARFRTPNEITRWRATTIYTKEPATIEWLRSISRESTLVDVGANIGVYTVFAALARRARVFAFEPESENYALLNENVRLNGLEGRVLAFCAGLSERSGIDRLYLSQPQAGSSCHSLGAEVGFSLEPRRSAFTQGALALRFDDLVASGDMPIPQYFKIDVDGHEHKVIRGMERTLRDARVCSLIVELNPKLPEHLEIREFLGALRFHWDPEQVEAAARKNGPFEGVAEHVFRR